MAGHDLSVLKSIYNVLPFKKQVFTLLKAVYVPPHKLYQHLHFNGFFNVRIEKNKKFKLYHTGSIIENEIFWEGLYNGWEKKSMQLWAVLCKNAKVIFDIGANTGVYSLVAKTVNPSAKVYAFEPVPGVYRYLQLNAKANNCDIECIEIAVSDYDGKAKVYLPADTDFVLSVTLNKNTVENAETKELEVATCKLSTFISSHNVSETDLMKIDVETHEFEVLKGMEGYLAPFKPTLLIEVLNDEIAGKLNSILSGMGYVYYNINDVAGTVKKSDKITRSEYYNFLVCSPQTASSLGL